MFFRRTGILLLTIGLLMAIPLPGIGETASSSPEGSLPTPSAIASEPFRVQVGLYILDIAKMDLKENQFFADFYIWYKWKDTASFTWSPEGIEFMNGQIEFASKIATDTLGDLCYASQRIKGYFRGKFNLQTYPFDTQTLPISLEDNQNPFKKLILEPDPNNPDIRKWIESSVQVPDWEIKDASIVSDVHRYGTDFGDSFTTKEKVTDYSRFHFQVQLKRLFIPHLIKFIIPLIVIAGMAYLVFFINAKEFEAQCGICVTALLTAVALHTSQANALPAVGYLVISDKIFILFYIVIYSALMQTVIANNYAKTGRIEVAAKMDRIFAIAYPALLILGGLFLMT